jgi:hypothetical protein
MHADEISARLSLLAVLPDDVDGPVSMHESSSVAGSNQL